MQIQEVLYFYHLKKTTLMIFHQLNKIKKLIDNKQKYKVIKQLQKTSEEPKDDLREKCDDFLYKIMVMVLIDIFKNIITNNKGLNLYINFF